MLQVIGNLRYDDRLKYLRLTRLEKRTIRSDLIETNKITNGRPKYDINRLRDLIFEIDDVGLRGHDKLEALGQCIPPPRHVLPVL